MSYYLKSLDTKLRWIQNGFYIQFQAVEVRIPLHQRTVTSRYTNEHCTMRKFWEVHILIYI